MDNVMRSASGWRAYRNRPALVRGCIIASRRTGQPAYGHERGRHTLTVFPSATGQYKDPLPKELDK